jgi:hypothetical protein
VEGKRSGRLRSLLIGTVVAVALTGGAEASGDGVASAAIAHAAPVAAVDQPDCRSRADCGLPVKGGLDITFTGWSCTTAFMTEHLETRDRYVLTAGHCVTSSGLYARWSHNGRPIGRAAFEAFHDGSNADVGAISVHGSAVANQVYGSSNADIRLVNGSLPDASQTVGSEVCRSGGTSGWRCGTIVATGVDVMIEGKLIRRTWWTDFPSAKGDSGAPVLDSQGRAMGIVIATTATRTVYSTIDGISAELDVRLCVDSECARVSER